MALTVLRNEGNIDVIAGKALKIYYEANDWLDTKEFQARLAKLYEEEGSTIDLTSGGQYLGKMKPALYFGFLEAKSESPRKNFHRITESGKSFYKAYLDQNEDDMVELMINAIKTTNFGHNNPAVKESDSDIQAPVVFLKSNIVLSGVEANEYAYILQELDNGASFDQLLLNVALYKKQGKSINELVTNHSYDLDNGIVFLCKTGLTENCQKTSAIKEKYISKYSDVIKNLSIYRKDDTDSIITPEARKIAFEKYIYSNCTEATAQHLLNDIEKDIVKDYVLEITGNEKDSIYEITDADVVEKIADKVSSDPRNRVTSGSGVTNYGGYPLTACNHYKDFIINFVNGNITKILPEQLIYYGAPGTGKSQKITKKEKAGELTCKRITFHPDTEYSSFVGSYKPLMYEDEDGNESIKYTFQEQIFLDIYFSAWNNKNKQFAIVIEEINRGNCAQIFGDIFQLLDRRDDGYSNYPIVAESDIKQIMKNRLPSNYASDIKALYMSEDGSKSYIENGWEMLTLPPNLSIYATMNTSDNSLYRMDSAFKRRWKWEYIKIEYNEPLLQNVKLNIPGLGANHWLTILNKLNQFIKQETQSTSKQIGQWFIIPAKVNNIYSNISFKDFRDKIMFYLFNDVFKDTDSIKDIIAPNEDFYLYEDLVSCEDEGVSKCKAFIDFLLTD